MTTAPACTKCRTAFPAELFSTQTFAPCPECKTLTWLEAFPNFGKAPSRGRAAELSVGGEEARCFYHETRKAAEVCDLCGRFLCGLCDCPMNGQHYCPGCLEKGGGRIQQLDNSRTLYGRQAFLLSILPLYITGIIAVFIALRYRKAPVSLVNPQRWTIPAALVLGLLQTIGFTVLIILGVTA